MKKSYLILAAVAGLFASCSQNEDVTKIVEEDTPILFEQYTNNVTRAEIVDEQALAQAGGFKVWGYKAKTTGLNWSTSTKTTIFDATVVTGTDVVSPEWTYTPLKYWDKTSSYKFFAGGPVNHTNGTLAWNSDLFTVTGAQSGKAATSLSDFVIDRVVKEADGATPPTAVSFDFHHIMAKLTFKVQRTVDATINITSMTMTGWNSGNGNFAQSKVDGTWTSIDCTEWTIPTAGTGDITLIGTGAGNESVSLTTNDATTLTDVYIMVPQAIAANTLTFTLTYTLNGETFSDQVGVLADAQTWGTDTSNEYTIKVGPQAILFDVASVCDFCVAGNTENVVVD